MVLFTSSFVITFSLIFYTLYSIVEYTNQWSQNTVETISNYSSNEKILDKDLPNLSLNQDFIKTGFYVHWDSKSNKSLLDNYGSLDYVFMEWLYLNTEGKIAHYDKEKENNLSNFLKSEGKSKIIIPMIHNYNAEKDLFDSKIVIDSIDTNPESESLITNLTKYLNENNYSGIAIDFEDIPYTQQYIYIRFIQKLNTELKKKDIKLFVMLPFARNDINYYQFSKYSDYIVLMAYDYSWNKSNNGPIAPQSWIQNNLRNLISYIPSTKLLLGIGAYGYDWASDSNKAAVIDYEKALILAKEYHSTISLDINSLNSTFKYEDTNKIKHTVWLLDSITAFNSIVLANKNKLGGVALWRIGSEDSRYWDIYKNPENIYTSLNQIQYPQFKYDLAIFGQGKVYSAKTAQKVGHREIQLDNNGYIKSYEFKYLPSTYELSRLTGDYNKRIALTFDDGPSEEYTKKILNILNENNTKASFFVIGSKVNSNSNVVKMIYQDGHDIGNHTYLHSNIQKLSKSQSILELNATQRVLEGYLNINTRLFRGPYGLDTVPDTKAELESISGLSDLGYYSVGYDIDTKDWLIKDKKAIKESIIKGVEERNGGIVLLHDGGGDRSETVEALKEIIPELKTRGYTFVTISSLIGISQSEIMPITKTQNIINNIDNAGFIIQNRSFKIISIIIVVTIIIGILRISLIILLSIIQKIRDNIFATKSNYVPSTTVVIPAWNEEKVILKTLDHLLSLKFKKFRIVVIDDGSTDHTFNKVIEKYPRNRRLRAFKIPNGGKSNAINYAISRCRSEVIIVQDADTLLNENAIPLLIRHFDNEKIGAVAGNVKVGNRKSLLTKLQALEYITSQNLDRRAFHLTNSISVVPGAIGAWRRKYVKQLGGFNSDTLAEDAELTYAMLANGYKVINEPNAIAYTEAPENMKDFIKQRFRWMFGTLQVSIKYLKYCLSLKRKSFGWITIPNVLFYNIIFPILSPFIDLFTILIITGALWQQIINDDLTFEGLDDIIIFSFGFILAEIVIALIAFILEPKETKRLLLYYPIQKVIYKYILMIVSIKTLLTALKGPNVHWEKKSRTANVEIPFIKALQN